jgi:hypothetical protein
MMPSQHLSAWCFAIDKCYNIGTATLTFTVVEFFLPLGALLSPQICVEDSIGSQHPNRPPAHLSTFWRSLSDDMMTSG